jgi:hypothetical protein
MRLFLTATLLVAVTMIILMPPANALIARMDFNDGHYTFRSLGGPKVCGEHLCKQGEWNLWIQKMMNHQLKNVQSAMVVKNTQQTSSIKKAAYNEENTLAGTLVGHIRGIVTYEAGTGKFTSFVSVSYDGILAINHIVISQQTHDINILKAWIGPNWKTTMTPSSATFDSSGASLDSGQIVNIVIITDGVPTFALDALASR